MPLQGSIDRTMINVFYYQTQIYYIENDMYVDMHKYYTYIKLLIDERKFLISNGF